MRYYGCCRVSTARSVLSFLFSHFLREKYERRLRSTARAREPTPPLSRRGARPTAPTPRTVVRAPRPTRGRGGELFQFHMRAGATVHSLANRSAALSF